VDKHFERRLIEPLREKLFEAAELDAQLIRGLPRLVKAVFRHRRPIGYEIQFAFSCHRIAIPVLLTDTEFGGRICQQSEKIFSGEILFNRRQWRK
jgi:hypothetical protein